MQLALFVACVYLFSIESRAFFQLSVLTLAGFTLHQLLPTTWRLHFFLLLSLSGITLVMGWANAISLICLGLALIGICHLPIAFRSRVALLVASGALLAVARGGLVPVPWSGAIWPILGSMFMFRLIVYMHDLRHETEPPSAVRTLSYFFLLPNICFPLFPVVDFKAFRRTYYDGKAFETYQTGLQWMLRGLVQLLLYRVVYYYGMIAPSEVENVGDLTRYLVCNFLLYLRVSGSFHIVVGMLHLFGLNLPETNHRWALASSFTDFWRRINIYWKDFMMKVFYYPAFFRMRKKGTTRALVLATLFVFLATWLLHSYQWFWLRGSFPVTWQDGLFWGVLAALVVVNSLREAQHGRQRTLGKRRMSPRDFGLRSLRTVGTFAGICVLWSLWTSESISQWLSLWVAAFGGGSQQPLPDLTTSSVLLGAAVAGTRMGPVGRPPGAAAGPRRLPASVLCLLGFAALAVSGHPRFYTLLGAEAAGFVDTLRQARLSAADAARLERGYYENLLNVDRFNSQLWEVYMKEPGDWQRLQETVAIRRSSDFQEYELAPDVAIQFQGKSLRTNRFAMRDRDYTQERPPDTFRAAVLGSSQVLGSGVADGENFESLVEERLNRERVGAPFQSYELLNLSVSGYGPLHQLAVLERSFEFDPQAVFFVAHTLDENQLVQHLARLARSGAEIPHPFLREIVAAAGVTPETASAVAERRLQPFGNGALIWTYQKVAETCRRNGILPVWIFLPLPHEHLPLELVQAQQRLAEEAGFVTVDLNGVYDRFDRKTIQVADWDYHPNAVGHQAVADRLFDELSARADIIFAAPAAASTATSTDRNEEDR